MNSLSTQVLSQKNPSSLKEKKNSGFAIYERINASNATPFLITRDISSAYCVVNDLREKSHITKL